MRLPYIQVTQETWEMAAQLAALLNVSAGDGFKLQADLWKWGLSLGPEDQPPRGICDSPRAARLMAAAVGFPLDRANELVEVLVDLKLIATLEMGLRVRGTKRYWSAWKRNRRTGHTRDHEQVEQPSGQEDSKTEDPRGTRAEPAVDPRGTRGEPKHQTQTQTQTQTQKKEKERERRKTLTPEEEQILTQCERVYATVLEAPYAVAERDRKAVPELRSLAREPAEVVARWEVALRKRDQWPKVLTLPELAQHWNQFPVAQGASP